MIRIRAKVRCETDVPRQAAISLNNVATGPEKPACFPIPDWIAIEGDHAGGYLLIHVYLRKGPFIHTLHQTLEEAKDDANKEFSIREEGWELPDEE
jgi:hypothetical protein